MSAPDPFPAFSLVTVTLSSDGVMHPVDTIRARTQVETERRPSLRQVTAEVWRRGGLRAFYAGFASVGKAW